jgi:hypothetical protein
MNRWLVGAVLGLGLAAGEAGAAGKPAWRSDLPAARAEARRAGKLLFVVFRCQP